MKGSGVMGAEWAGSCRVQAPGGEAINSRRPERVRGAECGLCRYPDSEEPHVKAATPPRGSLVAAQRTRVSGRSVSRDAQGSDSGRHRRVPTRGDQH